MYRRGLFNQVIWFNSISCGTTCPFSSASRITNCGHHEDVTVECTGYYNYIDLAIIIIFINTQ